MLVFGWIALAAGSALFAFAFLRMIRANRETHIPYFRNPPVNPSGTITMRSVGMGLLIIGAAALVSTVGFWVVLHAAGFPLILTFAGIEAHNRWVNNSTV